MDRRRVNNNPKQKKKKQSANRACDQYVFVWLNGRIGGDTPSDAKLHQED